VKNHNFDDLSNLSMLELFQVEVENQTEVITNGLLTLERDPNALSQLEALMRAAHSLKGAARIVNLDLAVHVAHTMEDCFVAAQQGRIQLRQPEIDLLFQGIDLLMQIAQRPDQNVDAWEAEHGGRIKDFLAELAAVTAGKPRPTPATTEVANTSSPAAPTPETTTSLVPQRAGVPDRVLRLTAENLNRLLGLAGESLVESRWLRPFADSLLRLKRMQADVAQAMEDMRDSVAASQLAAELGDQIAELTERVAECRQFLSDRLVDLDMFDRRSANLSHRLYLEVLQCRMRPFGEGIQAFPRMVRDLARSLGKEVRLEIAGENTHVDRDILDKLEAPLTHLLRNAVDHGCETPEERRRTGKPPAGTIHLEARHRAGMLMITVSDDGPGIDPELLRETIVQKRLINQSTAAKLSETELLEFLLLPGFTMRQTVTEISGRGIGLDIVHNMVKAVRGSIRIATQPGRGMRFQLHLPLTLSVLRTLLVEVAGEPYAIPLSQITRTLKLEQDRVETLEGRHYFTMDKQQVGLLTAHQVLDCGQQQPAHDDLPVVVLGDRNSRYGVVVDRFLGERELVVQPLDSRLGKIPDISAGSLMEDGSPVLIVDVEDMVASIEKLVSSGRLDDVRREAIEVSARPIKRILAVDDSLTVRELERKLLSSRGYITDVAVDGRDAWNAVRAGNYDLVITDVDMPRMDGIELATLMKQDARLKSVPVVIVSYKDREEDRLRGLEAGADYYLTKGSFHDETLLQAVLDLIGEADT